MTVSSREKLLSRVAIDGTSGCWLWQGPKDAHGFGWFRAGAPQYAKVRSVIAHRAAYQIFVGPIPDGMDPVQRCKNHGCVNPEHMHLVPSARTAPEHAPRVFTSSEIRTIQSSRESSAALSKRYGVSVSRIDSIQRGRRLKRLAHRQGE